MHRRAGLARWGVAALGLLLAAGLSAPVPTAAAPSPGAPAAPTAASWTQGQRVVLTVGRDGATTASRGVPVAARAVPASQPDTSRITLSPDQDAVRIELSAPGGATYRQVVPVERFIRAESAGPDGVIEGRRVPVRQYTFAATLPDLGPGATLRTSLVTRERTTTGARVALAAPEARSVGATAARSAAISGFPRGPKGNRVDLVIMGDGYTKAQRTAFAADAKAAADSLFSTHPYSRYKRYFNVVTAFRASKQSGADRPAYRSGCSADSTHPISCCPEQAAGTASSYKATRYDSSYCYFGIDRLLVPMREGRLMKDATKAYPRWDHLVVIVNDAKYGGSGGAIATTSTHPSGIEVVKHELGHSLLDLADEYDTPADYPACSDRRRNGIKNRCQANVTDVTRRSKLKWRAWVATSTPIPTAPPKDPGVVGLFRGAYYSAKTYYRSCSSCIMRTLGAPFGPVAAERMPYALYRRFDVSLLDHVKPGKRKLTVRKGDTRRFRVRVVAPAGDTVRVVWRVDGKVVKRASAAHGERSTFRYKVRNNKRHTVKVVVTERAATLHPRHVDVSRAVRSWRLR